MGSFMVGEEHCASRGAQWLGLIFSWLAIGVISVCMAICGWVSLSNSLEIDIWNLGLPACSAGFRFVGRRCEKARGRLFQGHYLELSRLIVMTERVSNIASGLCMFMGFMVPIYSLLARQ